MKKKLLLVCALALCAAMLTSCSALPVALSNMVSKGVVSAVSTQEESGDTVTISREEYEQYQKLSMLLEMKEIVDEYYYEDVDETNMLQGAAAGLLAGVGDNYTFYYTPEAFQDMWDDDEGEYAGVGLLISSNYTTNICTIIRVFDGTPAQKAGVRKGDILYQVEDVIVNPSTLQEAVDIMRGTPGTDVNVTFLRGDEKIELTMTRAIVNVTRVESTMLPDQVGLITLYEFAGDCDVKFKEALDRLTSEGMKALIIDLRDNPGGWVSQAEFIADLFLDEGVIYSTQYKEGDPVYTYSRDGKVDVPLVILHNGESASASEILTGALTDRAGATTVGTQSYGKGIIQAVLPVGRDGSGMQVTIAQYFTPNDRAVHKVGFAPDVEVALEEGDVGLYELGDLQDPQLKKAHEVALEKIQGTQE
ncbi:MAG: S41 family peptidase [Clostridia bacterium]|nr:S41 family peptidase [Clostridia bacterium]